jgi:hypothetical protein
LKNIFFFYHASLGEKKLLFLVISTFFFKKYQNNIGKKELAKQHNLYISRLRNVIFITCCYSKQRHPMKNSKRARKMSGDGEKIKKKIPLRHIEALIPTSLVS